MISRIAAGAMRRALAALAVVVTLAAVGPADGGGPLELVNHQPVVYPNGGASLVLNLDRGTLGTRTNAQAVTLVQNAIAFWNGVGTSTMRLSIGTPLAADYTTANYGAVYGNYFDGLNPIIFDTDGSITEAIFGVGTRSYVLGFAGSAYTTVGGSTGKYLEGQAVLNGYLNVSDATWTVVFAHELGHFFGLDHAQLDGSQGLPSNDYVLMYPIAYRTLQSLHEDDVAAVTSLYPSASAAAVYGQLTGTFTTAGGTPIRGANIWAKEIATGVVYSVVSDFLTQGTGYFRLYLPYGTYNLIAESIDPAFKGGSSVGPFANTANDVSFQSPHPIAPVALGAGTPVPILITPGCVATATFRLDGTGGVSGNCVPPSYLLSVTKSGTGSGTATSTPAGIACGNDCGESYTHGTTVGLTAAAAPGSVFTGWTGACSGTALTCAVSMTAARTVNAAFAALSNNANLGALALSPGTLSPQFASGTPGYTSSVAHGVTSITVTPTPADAGATVTVNGTPVAVGSASGPINLIVGGNPVTVLVTAANAINLRTYTIDVTRAQAATTTALDTSASPVAPGSGVMLTATVTGAGPTGSVSFVNGAALIAGCSGVALTGSGNSRTAHCATGPLSAGGYVFAATYGGDGNNAPSSGSVGQAVTSVVATTLDVDASIGAARYDALTDGVLVIRYLFNLTGPALTAGALGTTATRTDPAAIEAYLDGIRLLLDIDGNGTTDALTDGLLIQRYLFGLRGDSLIAGALDPLATRTTAATIEAYIESLMP